ncbi:hypothetical protein DITRI_Ditri10aG0065800 [Diplodiscus trichospermus]
MKWASKVIMGATLVMLVSLSIVLALILVLLAELYCSLLICKQHQLKDSITSFAIANTTTATTAAAITTISFPPQDNQDQSTSSLK